MTPEEITNKFELKSLTNRNFVLQPCCATSGQGLTEGLSMLVNLIRDSKASMKESKRDNGQQKLKAKSRQKAK